MRDELAVTHFHSMLPGFIATLCHLLSRCGLLQWGSLFNNGTYFFTSFRILSRLAIVNRKFGNWRKIYVTFFWIFKLTPLLESQASESIIIIVIVLWFLFSSGAKKIFERNTAGVCTIEWNFNRNHPPAVNTTKTMNIYG